MLGRTPSLTPDLDALMRQVQRRQFRPPAASQSIWDETWSLMESIDPPAFRPPPRLLRNADTFAEDQIFGKESDAALQHALRQSVESARVEESRRKADSRQVEASRRWEAERAAQDAALASSLRQDRAKASAKRSDAPSTIPPPLDQPAVKRQRMAAAAERRLRERRPVQSCGGEGSAAEV